MASSGGLPGLTWVKLIAYWQDSYPLECEAPVRANRELVWACKMTAVDGSAYLSMNIFGESGLSLSRISLSIVQAQPESAAAPERWLSYAAGIPMAGVPLDKVRIWAEAGGDGTMTAGNVKYALHVSGASRTLDITPVTK